LDLDEVLIPIPVDDDLLLALDEALNTLAEKDKTTADLIQLRFFAGLTMQQAADALGVPLRSAERLWTYGKTWLYRAVYGD
jgi:DNA-directed RNA polymerase specialized sigma24 family protein